jgi:hypothetical protein
MVNFQGALYAESGGNARENECPRIRMKSSRMLLGTLMAFKSRSNPKNFCPH